MSPGNKSADCVGSPPTVDLCKLLSTMETSGTWGKLEDKQVKINEDKVSEVAKAINLDISVSKVHTNWTGLGIWDFFRFED